MLKLLGRFRDFSLKNSFTFPLVMWLLSRGIIFFIMLGITPLLPAHQGTIKAPFSWEVFSAWDSSFYLKIATSGYDFTQGNFGADIAFFPLFPLAIRAMMFLGFSSEIAGVILNNFAFLGALIFLYQWLEEYDNINVARWSTAILAWCPFSLFGTVIYTEGIFLLFTTAALKTFQKKQYFYAAFWGILATATRITGLALIPAFLLTAWREKRPLKAYLTGIVSSLGILSYSFYCWLKFYNPIAFIAIQHTQWQPKQAFWGQGWIQMLAEVFLGPVNWNQGFIKDIWYPLGVSIIFFIGYLLWRFNSQLGTIKTGYGFCLLILLFWLIAGNPFLNTVIVLGSIYLLWYTRNQIPYLALSYGFFSLVIILSSGRTVSAERYFYGIVPLSFALGIVCSRYPRWGYITLGFFAFLLASFSLRFSQHLWVA